MANDPITSMVADPDFGKMPLDEQRKALSAHDANFNGLGDADLTHFVQAHQTARPETQTPTNAAGPIDINAQARAQMLSRIHQVPLISPGTEQAPITSPSTEQGINKLLPQVNQRVADIRKGALSIAGASVGGGAVQGAGLLPSLLRVGGAGVGGAIGNVAGSAVSGQVPNANEALQAGAGTALGQGVGEALSPFVKWLTASKNFGAQMLHEAAFKAGNAPVELSSRTNDLVDKLVETSKLGGKPVKVVSDLLERVGPSTKQAAEAVPGPLTYNEARILQGNMSSLSQEEQMGLKGSQKGLMKQLAQSFSRDVQKAADNAGIGMEHSIGMKEYAAASARNRALVKAGKIAATGAGIYGAEQVAKKAVGAIVRP